jgi:hypothetical protein
VIITTNQEVRKDYPTHKAVPAEQDQVTRILELLERYGVPEADRWAWLYAMVEERAQELEREKVAQQYGLPYNS